MTRAYWAATAMGGRVLVGLVVGMTVPALAAPPTPREKQLIAEAMNINFEACDREDSDAVMKSCADAMLDRDKFRREAPLASSRRISTALGSSASCATSGSRGPRLGSCWTRIS
jgi:hypothetical protein